MLAAKIQFQPWCDRCAGASDPPFQWDEWGKRQKKAVSEVCYCDKHLSLRGTGEAGIVMKED